MKFKSVNDTLNDEQNKLSLVNKVPALFTPLTIRNVTLRNRICATPMSMYSSRDGMASDFHFGHLQSFALGGVALVMTEATAVTPEGRISASDCGLWSDQHIRPFARIVDQIKSFGAIAGIQLGHSGRKGSCEVLWAGGESLSDGKGGWPTIAPSPLAFGNQIWKVPKEATIDDLLDVRKAFIAAANRAVKAGFQVIELHFGNGYLVHQFLSPVTNKRSDRYGGNLENRMRLALEIAGAVRETLPDTTVLGVRVSVSDLVSNGWDIPQTIELAKELKALGVDFMSCSSGQLVPRSQTNAPALFTPITIRGVTFRNRISVSPMATSASEEGMVTDFHLGHLQGFAMGGAALVMTEATAVSPQGLISPTDNGIWGDQHIAPLARIVKEIKKYGGVAGIQLNHSGRKGSCKTGWEGGATIPDEEGGWPTVAPSAIAYDNETIWRVPKEATIEDIEQIKAQFAAAAQRAVKAGFEVIQLHFAHGYIVHQFMSPLTNKRTDNYGGSLQNRMRFGLEVAESVAKVIPDNVVLGARITVSDGVRNGWDVPSAVEFAKQLKPKGLDMVDCSGYSGLTPYDPNNRLTDSYAVQLTASERMQKEAGLVTSVIGGVFSPKYANQLVANGTASMVMLGRAFLNNPHWPYHAADVLGVQQMDLYPKYYGYAISGQ
ncbi:unnamed protein product, partial [Medioppia subpectinata]